MNRWRRCSGPRACDEARHKLRVNLHRLLIAWGLDTHGPPEQPANTLPLIGRKPLLGEAGVGKSSVLRAAFAEAALLQCREGLAQTPFRPVVEFLQTRRTALRQLLSQADGELAAYRLDLAVCCPSWPPMTRSRRSTH